VLEHKLAVRRWAAGHIRIISHKVVERELHKLLICLFIHPLLDLGWTDFSLAGVKRAVDWESAFHDLGLEVFLYAFLVE
jgi:hypothetical protein